jgi:hypothetical protein
LNNSRQIVVKTVGALLLSAALIPGSTTSKVRGSYPAAQTGDLGELSRSASITLKPSPTETVQERWSFEHAGACSAVLRHDRTDDQQSVVDQEAFHKITEMKENYPIQFSQLTIQNSTDDHGNPFLLLSGSSSAIWTHYGQTAKFGWQDPRFTSNPTTTVQREYQAKIILSGANQDGVTKVNSMSSILQSAKAQCTGNAYIDPNWLSEGLEIQPAPIGTTPNTKSVDQLRSELSNYLNTYTDFWRYPTDTQVEGFKAAFQAPGEPPIDDSYLASSSCILWIANIDNPTTLNIIRLADLIAPSVGSSTDNFSTLQVKNDAKLIYQLGAPGGIHSYSSTNSSLLIKFSSSSIRKAFDKDMFFLIKGCAGS